MEAKLYLPALAVYASINPFVAKFTPPLGMIGGRLQGEGVCLELLRPYRAYFILCAINPGLASQQPGLLYCALSALELWRRYRRGWV
jgi:hypothetical protein